MRRNIPAGAPRSNSSPKRTTRLFLVAAALAACGGLGAIGLQLRHAAPHAGAAGEATPARGSGDAWRPRWTPGLAYTFAFTWSGESHATLAQGAPRVGVAYDLAGDLVARAAATEGGTVLELHLANLSRHVLQAFGADTVPDAAILEAPRAWGVVGANGAVAKLRFPADAPKPFREALTKLVEQMHVTPNDKSDVASRDWTAVEPGPNGRATAAYHVEGSPLALTRARAHYESLSALSSGACAACEQHLTDHAAITLDPRGVVASLDDSESLRLSQQGSEPFAATNHFTLRLKSVVSSDGDSVASLPPGATDDRAPGERATLTARDEQAILEHEAAGFDQTQLDSAIDLFARKGEQVADKTWLVHARAYLLLHPEAVEAVGQRLAAPDVSSRGRNMMLQVLAVVGNPRAQEILVRALDGAKGSEPARSYGHLVQKLVVVEHPTAATVAYAEDTYRAASLRGDRAIALSGANAMGGLASHLAKDGDASGAKRIVNRLEADLKAATVSEDKRGLILALKSAGAADDAEVRAYASDDSAVVRDEVARSLADIATPDARQTLLSLTSDSEEIVASSAIQSLGRDNPAPADVHAVAASVLGGQTAPTLDGSIMDFFAGNLDAPDTRSVLGFLLARTKDPVLARRLRGLLEQLAT